MSLKETDGPLNGFPFTCSHRYKAITHTDSHGVYHRGYECALLEAECNPTKCPYIIKQTEETACTKK